MDELTMTSLLIRETTIAAGAAGKLSRALDEVARVLRQHLRDLGGYDKMASNKGRSGAEQSEAASLTDPFQADLFEGRDVEA